MSLTKDNKLYLGEKLVTAKNYIQEIKTKLVNSKEKSLFLRADEKIAYGRVAKLMGKLRSNGISRISLITEVEKE